MFDDEKYKNVNFISFTADHAINIIYSFRTNTQPFWELWTLYWFSTNPQHTRTR